MMDIVFELIINVQIKKCRKIKARVGRRKFTLRIMNIVFSEIWFMYLVFIL